MTDQQEVRIFLGPVAKGLITGVETKKPTALDNAIIALQEEVATLRQELETASRQAEAPAPQSLLSDEILATLNHQSDTITRLCEAVAIENKMTRLLFGTVAEDSGSDDPQLREMVEQVIDNIYAKSSLLNVDQRDDILQKQDAYITATRSELDRAPMEIKEMKEEELER